MHQNKVFDFKEQKIVAADWSPNVGFGLMKRDSKYLGTTIHTPGFKKVAP